jgi:DNA repair protein RadD
MQLRDYQQKAVSEYFKKMKLESDKSKRNYLLVIPTGGGKTPIYCYILNKFIHSQPYIKALVVTHNKELISQGFSTFKRFNDKNLTGLCCAGLNSYDTHLPITFASIGTIFKRMKELGELNLIIIDEAHKVSLDKRSQYFKLIEHFRSLNPNLAVLGLSATPYRLKQGLLWEGEDALFNGVAYDLTKGDDFLNLIDNGYLADLSTKEPNVEIDVTGVKTTGGDYNVKELEEVSDTKTITESAIDNMIAQGGNRKCWLVFAVSIEHCENISKKLNEKNISSMPYHSKQTEKEREKILAMYKAGKLRCLVNMNTLSVGFDHPKIDLIGLLRPTKSVSLFVQIVGRGLRPVYADGYDLSTQEGRLQAIQAGSKPNGCLVLDFAGNTKRMGAINSAQPPSGKRKKKGGEAIMKTCPQCSEIVHSAVRYCPKCNHKFEFKTKIVETAHAGEIVKRKKEVAPKHEWFTVRSVAYSLHTKQGSPDMVKVTYNVGVGLLSKAYTEYLCLNHSGYARHKSLKWVTERLPDGCNESKHKALCHGTASFLTNAHLIKKPSSIQVWVNKKYPSITEYKYEGASNVSN